MHSPIFGYTGSCTCCFLSLRKTGDSNDVKLRIEEVLVYVQPFETVFSTVLRMVKYQFARPNVKNALTLKTFVKAI